MRIAPSFTSRVRAHDNTLIAAANNSEMKSKEITSEEEELLKPILNAIYSDPANEPCRKEGFVILKNDLSIKLLKLITKILTDVQFSDDEKKEDGFIQLKKDGDVFGFMNGPVDGITIFDFRA